MNVVIGDRMQEFLALQNIPSARIRVIENWADGEAIVPLSKEESMLRHSLGKPGDFWVVYSGNLGRAHEYATFLDAASELATDADVKFVMIGGGAQIKALRSAAQDRCLSNFIFLPYQPRESLNDSLGAADVHLACLLPALEGLVVPSKFYGILAAGRPVLFIGDPDGELGRIIQSTRCGAVIATGDADALVEKIRRLMSDPSVLQATGARARQLFDERYTLAMATAKWVRLLRDVDRHEDVMTRG